MANSRTKPKNKPKKKPIKQAPIGSGLIDRVRSLLTGRKKNLDAKIKKASGN